VQKTWIEIHAGKFKENVKFFRERLENHVTLSLVIKSNAYGHGLEEIARLGEKNGIQHFCVHTLEEALEIKKHVKKATVLIMGYMATDEVEKAIAQEIEMVCFNLDFIETVSKTAKGLNRDAIVHLKVETGTNRLGMGKEEIKILIPILQKIKNVRIKGLYTHYANIEDTTDHSYAQDQLTRFLAIKEMLDAAGIQPEQLHTACSAAILLFPQTHFQLVRLGISQYGLWPSRETYLSYLHKKKTNDVEALKPILTWKTRVAQVKNVSEGAFVGYGCTYKLSRDSKIAVLPIGYADGYDRKLSNQGYVLIKGKRAPIRGRICMNLTMVDVTDIPEAAVHDEVVLIGNQGDENISVEQVAAWADTIHYEVITNLGSHIPRKIINND